MTYDHSSNNLFKSHLNAKEPSSSTISREVSFTHDSNKEAFTVNKVFKQ